MITLAPTVHERISQCATQVYIDGLVNGATVEISINGSTTSFTATKSYELMTVRNLSAGEIVKARQNSGSGFSSWSAEVIVEQSMVPPTSAPNTESSIESCSQHVRVWGCTPGAAIEITQGTDSVGKGVIDRNGQKCIPIRLNGTASELIIRSVVCDTYSPERILPLEVDRSIPIPMITSPLFGCQNFIPIRNMLPGTRIRMESDIGGSLGSYGTCRIEGRGKTSTNLTTGHRVRAQAYWDYNCNGSSAWSAWKEVAAPDDRIRPGLREVLIENDQIIRVHRQIGGAELKVYIAQSNDPIDISVPTIYGPRPASEEQEEISLNVKLQAGQVVWVDQTLCNHTVESNKVEVLPPPPEILAPTVLAPITSCAWKVTVVGLYPGALVRVYQDGFPIAIGWSGTSSSHTFHLAPGLIVGGAITAVQWVGGQESPVSNTVIVEDIKEVSPPRILSPVTLGDHRVWVSGVTSGAKVSIFMNGHLIGEADSAESMVRVNTMTITDPVYTRVLLCNGEELTSDPVTPILSPCARGKWSRIGRQEMDYGIFELADWPDGQLNTATGDILQVPLRGELRFPRGTTSTAPASGGPNIDPHATNCPLIVIAHGYQYGYLGSHEGYRYLSKHLARWGMIVYSVDLETINAQIGSLGDPPYQNARGEAIRRNISALFSDPDLSGFIDPNRVGLIGHSMGGEAVVLTQEHTLNLNSSFSIKGVVSIAPTQYMSEVSLREAEYFQLSGSKDILLAGLTLILGDDSDALFNGMRIFDRAERNKSEAFIYGGVHNPFNTVWEANLGGNSNPVVSSGQHRTIAKCLINAFFQKVLFGELAYEGYLEGLILPPSIRGIEIYQQHLKTQRQILDNYGDRDSQAGLITQIVNKLINRQSGANYTGGTGLQIWEDVSTLDADRNVHNTSCVELAWNEPGSWYALEGSLDMSNPEKMLSFRICQYHEDLNLNVIGGDIDLMVEISDGQNTAEVRMGLIGHAQYPDLNGTDVSVFRSIRIPSDAFSAVNTHLNMGNITQVKFNLSGRPTGHVLIDDIEFDN